MKPSRPRKPGPRRSAVVEKRILKAVESGAGTLTEIARLAQVDVSTAHYHLVRKREAKKDDTLVKRGLVRARKRFVLSKGEGKAKETFWAFSLTPKGREVLEEP